MNHHSRPCSYEGSEDISLLWIIGPPILHSRQLSSFIGGYPPGGVRNGANLVLKAGNGELNSQKNGLATRYFPIKQAFISLPDVNYLAVANLQWVLIS